MKTHKIKGVDISTCSAEQMISYNFANTYKTMPAEWIAQTAKKHMNDNPERFRKYDQNLIVALITQNAGKTYKGQIAASYEQVGKFFPVDF